MHLKHYSELTEVGQLFIDAVGRNNGRDPQRTLPPARPIRPTTVLMNTCFPSLAALIKPLDPDMGYDNWLRVGMALHHATDGSEEGLVIFDDWSAGGIKYPGFTDIEYKWRTFKNCCECPVTIATVIWMLREQGHDSSYIGIEAESQFENCETEVIDPSDISVTPDSGAPCIQGGAA